MDVTDILENHPLQVKPPQNRPTDLTSSDLISLPWIIHHTTRGHLPSGLSLRAMFSFNSGQPHPKLTEVYHFWGSNPKGKLVIEFLSSLEKISPSLDDTRIEDLQLPPCGPIENINPDHAPEDRFMDANNDRLLDFDIPQRSDLSVRRENKGLPPDFVGNLCLNRIFTESLEEADFKNALTGLDYLGNLECSRRTALREAAQRMRINEYTWRSVLIENYEAWAWVYSIQQQEEEIERYYSALWVDLRIWTMIKELQAEPFYKPNVIALLNTLFPPVIKELPSPRISEKVLYQYRNSFYRYIVSIEVDGKSVLDGFVENLNRPRTAHNWPNTRQNLKDYIGLASSMIRQATSVHSISFFKHLPEEFKTMRPHRGSGTASDLSDPISLSNGGVKPSQTELKRILIESSGRCENTEDSVDCNWSGSIGKRSLDPIFVPVPRSRISGKPLTQNIRSQDDIDALFQGESPSPWYSSPRRQSSVSGQGSFETNSSCARLHSSSFSRPTTPSLEQQRFHRHSSSMTKRISYEFRNALPGTPELPSPVANDKDVSEASTINQMTPLSEKTAYVKKSHETDDIVAKKRKLAFSFFRWKKKLDKHPEPKMIDAEVRKGDSSMDASSNASQRPITKPIVVEQPTLNLKPSFGFPNGFKSRNDSRSISDSNSERTITQAIMHLRPRRSLNNLIANKSTSTVGLNVKSNDNGEVANTTTGTIPRHQHVLHKARSWSSVKSSNSTYSNEGCRNTPRSSSSALLDENRIVTGDDIDEPFPFGNFVQPQTPAILLENSFEARTIEDIRKELLDKARKERMAKWEQSEESKRKLEAAQQRRRMLREEMNVNIQASKIRKQTQNEEKEKLRVIQARTKSGLMTPDPGSHSSDKPPKTPLKARILKEIANAYSPGS